MLIAASGLASVAQAASVRLCADFSLFADNTPFPQRFPLSGFSFADARLFANQTAGETGLQFANTGLKIALPTSVQAVTMRTRNLRW